MPFLQSITQSASTKYAAFDQTVVKPGKATMYRFGLTLCSTPNTVMQLAQKTLLRPLLNVYDAIDDRIEEVRVKLHNGCVHFASNIIPLLILPSLNNFSEGEVRAKVESLKEEFAAISSQSNNKCEQVTLQVNDKTLLDGVRLIHDSSTDAEQRKVIVIFNAYNQIWQYSFDYLKKLFHETGRDIICYNYRGTGLSSGYPKSEHDLVQEGELVVKNLRKEGYLPKNITLCGKDLGALIAAQVAASNAKDDLRVQTVLDRCPKNIQVVISHIGGQIGKNLGDIVARFGWQLNTELVLPKLEGKIVVIHNATDKLVLPSAAINKEAIDRLQSEPTRLQQVHYIGLDDKKFAQEAPEQAKLPHCNGHSRPFTKDEMQQVLEAIKSL